MNHHPASEIFPMMDPEAFTALVADIRVNGLIEPIVLDSIGNILDGRNRYQACIEAGVSPRFSIYEGSNPVAYVTSVNLHRRHLTASQKALVAACLAKEYEEPAKERQGTRNDITPRLEESERGEAVEKAAREVGVSRGYTYDAKQIMEQSPELAGAVAEGRITIPEAKRELEVTNCDIKKPHVSYNNGDNEWYTPQTIADAARKAMGSIDLDPASTQVANDVIQARKYFTADDNGLEFKWDGNVWMNPPYAQPLIEQFCSKLCQEITHKNVSQAIALVNNATETAWFQKLAAQASAICFPRGRVRFWNPNKVSQPLQGQAIVYFGEDTESFADAFRVFGAIWYGEF